MGSSSPCRSDHQQQLEGPLLCSLSVFQHTLNQELIRSVHVYQEVDDENIEGSKEERRVVEREFLFSPASCVELTGHPFLLLVVPSTAYDDRRTTFWEGQNIGLWLCILAFDSSIPFSCSPIPPILSISRNPGLNSVPSLASDLHKIFQLKSVSNLEGCTHYGSRGSCAAQKANSLHSAEHLPAFHQDDESHSSCCSTVSHLSDHRQNKLNSPEIELLLKKKKKKKRKRAATKHVANIALKDLVKCFNLPIIEASKMLNVGLTVLKRRCREFGIPRWPHRKIKSLDSLIHDIQEEVTQQERENKAAAAKAAARRQQMLECEKKSIEKKPFMELQRETKRFRQDVFKKRHRVKAFNQQAMSSTKLM